jgi:hypothetical protein
MTNTKSLHIKDLEIEFATLQAQFLEIDLDNLKTERDAARAAIAAHEVRGSRGADPDWTLLSIAASAADNALSSGNDRARHLEDAMHPLRAMLSSPARVVKAQQDADSAAAALAAAAQDVAEGQATVDRLAAQLDTAKAGHALARDAAAKAMLDAAREGKTPPTGAIDPAQDDTQVETLESALAMARAELAAVQLPHDAAEQAHREALDMLQAAQRDAVRLEHECAMRDFAPFVARLRKATGQDYFPGNDLRRHVAAAERMTA